jgi:hypothetical protein
MPSKRYSLDEVDLEKWTKNVILFSIPCLVAFLTEVQSGKTITEALPYIYIAFINALIDILKKWQAGEVLG